MGRKGLARVSEVIADAEREGQEDFGFWILDFRFGERTMDAEA